VYTILEPEENMEEYGICSIYFDMLNTPVNLDIKKYFEMYINENNDKKYIFAIRILKKKNILGRLREHIIDENSVDYHGITMPGVLWSRDKIDILDFTISNKWAVIQKSYKPVINKYIFITSNPIIKEIIRNNQFCKRFGTESRNVYLLTDDPETPNQPTQESVLQERQSGQGMVKGHFMKESRYSDYLLDDTKGIMQEIKYYNQWNWCDRPGNGRITKRVFYILNKTAEGLNIQNRKFVCYTYCVDIKDINECEKYVGQYIMYFDITN
jgi:hypothetical protein